MAKKIEDGLTPQQRYERKNLVQVIVRFNRKTDADILARMEAVSNKQGYIKSLIRADIARHATPADE